MRNAPTLALVLREFVLLVFTPSPLSAGAVADGSDVAVRPRYHLLGGSPPRNRLAIVTRVLLRTRCLSRTSALVG